MRERISREGKPWFWKWILNNQFVTGLLIVLLILLIMLIFTKVSYLFEPVGQFITIVGLPVVTAGILYYLMNPLVDHLQKKGVKRIYSIIGLFIFVLLLIVWAGIVIVPAIRDQIQMFSNNMPKYINTVTSKGKQILEDPMFNQFRSQIEETARKMMDSLGEMAQKASSFTFKGLGNLVSMVANFFIVLVTAPIILFFLLKDGKELKPYFLKFVPTKWRSKTGQVLSEMNQQVASYIRGQLTVAFAVAVMFTIGFSIIGLDYAITLGILSGFLNLIPYLGSFLAMIPAVFLGIVAGPVMLLKVIVVFAIEQTIEGRLISPLVLGNQLKVHPVTIMFVLLTAGKIFGVVGVILGIPVYAAAKVVVTHIFEWYKDISGMYEKDEEQTEQVVVTTEKE